jgi:glycosyltransferase involved in cell wall biosynthesis
MTDFSEPAITVIIPVWNCERYLGEAIESVLAQTRAPEEILVIDDGSTDGSRAVAEGYAPRVTYHLKGHSGIGDTRNAGVLLAGSDVLAFLDADDLWMGDKLEEQLVLFQADPSLDAVFGLVEQFHSPDAFPDNDDLQQPRQVYTGKIAGTMLIKKTSFQRVGSFGSEWQVGEFVDWYARAVEKGLRSITLDRIVLRRRIHGSNTVIRERASQADYLKILKASLDRRRIQESASKSAGKSPPDADEKGVKV